MKNLITLLFLGLLTGQLLATPRFAMMEEVSCSGCHLYEGGGAGRNSYGKDYVNESLAFKYVKYPWTKETSESPFYFGVDTRYQLIAAEDQDLRQFPMQAALYAGAEYENIIAHVEVNRILNDFRITGGMRYQNLPYESWISVARELPVMGWRIDDHTVFTRGGNLTPMRLDHEGLPYTPFLEPPDQVEFGSAPVGGLELSLTVGIPFIESDENPDVALFKTLKANYTFSTDLVAVMAGVAYLNEGEINARVVNWGVSGGNIIWLGEIAGMNNWPNPDISNIAMLQQVSYRLLQGMDIIGRYEYFDPDTDIQTGAISRSSLGLELFPLPGIELKVSYRRSQFDLPQDTVGPKSQFLGQIHLYL